MRIALARSAAVAVVAAFASIAVMAGPASAAVVPAEIQTGSTLTIDPTGTPTVFNLGDPPNPPYTCATNPPIWTAPTIAVDFDGVGGTFIDAPSAYSFPRTDFVAGGTTFQIQIEGVNDTFGTIDPATDSVSQPVSLRARVYNCNGSGPVCTTGTITPTLTGTYNGAGFTPVTGDDAHVTGSAVVTTQFGCNAAVAAAINGKVVAVDLQLEF